jgi:hypothetical protein
MADQIRIVDYYYVRLGDRPGEGRRFLEHVSEQGINLVAFTAFPAGANQTQIDFVTESPDRLEQAAADASVPLVGPRKAILIQGDDRRGALHEHHLVLANAGVNVYASHGTCDGTGRFGFILWVEPEDLEKASEALGIE